MVDYIVAVDIEKLADEIIDGKRIQKGEDLSFFLEADLEVLCKQADRLRAYFCGDRVDLCTIINGKSGRCREDCKFCSQSAHNHTGCGEYEFLDVDTIVKAAKANESEHVDRFSIVTSGHKLDGEDFEKAIEAYERMHRECKIGLCASMGFLDGEQFRRLRAAGVTSYHDNIETSRRNFPNICTTHTFDQKISTIKLAQEAGLSVCSGGIIGMGETWEDRIDMALCLAQLGIESIPINVLNPIPGTPFAKLEPVTEDDVKRTFAIFRFINPTANVRLAAGRMGLHESGKDIFDCGASATITGNLLTTSGSTIRKDRDMLLSMGRDIVPAYER